MILVDEDTVGAVQLECGVRPAVDRVVPKEKILVEGDAGHVRGGDTLARNRREWNEAISELFGKK